MNVIICLDQNNGMLFNNRRQSRDRIVRKNILEYINGAKLYMDEYSFKQFSEDKADNIVVCDNFSNVEDSDFCFVEKQNINTEQINKLIVYRWDKIYPADVRFDMDNVKLNLTETLEFQGYSHEKIVREIYE
ncbi:ribonuclease Z [uncultured Eubacterium sp.]|uniref:ribonuclease Z n=1 Tax=uncultured Eubacterium sp. TaxID=165185 RepID=UPI002591AFD8|nr:ribonuclease Z [uncultured Eubacterium sp.]